MNILQQKLQLQFSDFVVFVDLWVMCIINAFWRLKGISYHNKKKRFKEDCWRNVEMKLRAASNSLPTSST